MRLKSSSKKWTSRWRKHKQIWWHWMTNSFKLVHGWQFYRIIRWRRNSTINQNKRTSFFHFLRKMTQCWRKLIRFGGTSGSINNWKNSWHNDPKPLKNASLS
jgi:hypothetical protein